MSNFFDEGTNAVNNTDGFSTGYLEKKKKPTKPTFGVPVNNNVQNTQSIPVAVQQNQFNQQAPQQNQFNQQAPQQMANRPNPNQMANRPMNNQQRPQSNANRQAPQGNRVINNPRAMQKQTGATVKNNSKKFGKYINYLSMSILVATIVIVLLIAGGVINVNKNKKGKAVNETPVVQPTEDEQTKMISNLNIACGALDEDGKFGSQPQLDDPDCNVLVCFLKDTVSCQNHVCMVAGEANVYQKNCDTGTISKANKDDFQAIVNIEEACDVLKNNPGNNGNYDGSHATCTNYHCVSTYGKSTKEMDCERS